MKYYAEAFKTAGRGTTPEQDKECINQNWLIGNVDHCVRELTTFIQENRITDFVTWAVPPSLRPDGVESTLHQFATKVVPHVKDAVRDQEG